VSYFVDFVTLCSRFVATAQDERDLMKSDLGTGDNEENEEESNSLSFCAGSVPRGAIISGTNDPTNSLQSTPRLSCDSALARAR
jgi:hypothetical protein